MTITATKEAEYNANIRDLNLVIVTPENIELFRGLQPRLGDIYKQVIMPTGALALVPIKAITLDDLADRYDKDREGTSKTSIILVLNT